ncbi:MAG: hypothetical protein IKT41_00735 [Clostridia bacterium]|nr:hypothetical protein [Clostridia bacterium]
MKKVFSFIIKISFLVVIVSAVCAAFNIAVLAAFTAMFIALSVIVVLGLIWMLLSML